MARRPIKGARSDGKATGGRILDRSTARAWSTARPGDYNGRDVAPLPVNDHRDQRLMSLQMTVSALVNTERPIILIYNPDQGRPDEYAEIEFKTQADANAAVTQLNAIFKTATRITFKQQQSNP
jgi:RNA recognition motif-containing protein